MPDKCKTDGNVKLRDYINIALRPLGSVLKRPGWGDDWHQDVTRLLPADGAWCIFDCGANEGQTLEEIHPLFPNATFHAFEPFPDTFRILQQNWSGRDHLHLHPLALGSSNTESPLYINPDSATNSLLSNAPIQQSEVQATVKIQQQTLESFASEQKIDRIDLLKMDCQGYELEILKGAAPLLSEKRIDVIYTEVLFAPLYKNQAYFDDLCALLRKYGYQLLALYDGRRSDDGHLMWSNALFSKVNRQML